MDLKGLKHRGEMNIAEAMVASYCHSKTIEYFDDHYKIVKELKDDEEFIDPKTVKCINRYIKNNELMKSLLISLEEPPKMTKKEYSRYVMLDRMLDNDFDIIIKYCNKVCRKNNIDIDAAIKEAKKKLLEETK